MFKASEIDASDYLYSIGTATDCLVAYFMLNVHLKHFYNDLAKKKLLNLPEFANFRDWQDNK